MSQPKIKNSKGQLTNYGLACGYIERSTIDNISTELSKDGCLHVKQYDHNQHKRIFWETFEPNQLAQARQRYSRAIANLKAVKQHNRRIIAEAT